MEQVLLAPCKAEGIQLSYQEFFLLSCVLYSALLCFVLQFVCIYDLLSSLMFCLVLCVCIYPSLSLKMSFQAENRTLVVAVLQENCIRVAVKEPDPKEKLFCVQILVLSLASYITLVTYLNSLKSIFLICDSTVKFLICYQEGKIILAFIFGNHYQTTYSKCFFNIYLI